MELKAQALKIADADQVGRYKTALQERGEKRIILWLVATRIPTHVRESLDDLLIEYAEIHVAQFKRVAEEHGFSVDEESVPNSQIPPPIEQKEIHGRIGMTIHDRIRTAIAPYRGQSLTAAKITELVLAKYPDTNRTSLCISGHSDSPAPSNQDWCRKCSNAQLLHMIEPGLYQVLDAKDCPKETPPLIDQKETYVSTSGASATRPNTPGRMITVAEAMDRVGERLQQQYGGAPIPTSIIKSEVQKLGYWQEWSIIPSDFCYNRKNKGSNPVLSKLAEAPAQHH